MTVASNLKRSYRQVARAESKADTRQRIVEAAVSLHLERGPTQTSINAVAERAGVNRVTVYRHFPDTRTLLEACSAHSQRLHPPPELAGWRQIEDPRERTAHGLEQLYDYFRLTEAGWASLLRDAEIDPLVREMVEQRRLAFLREARDTLLAGWPVSRGRRVLLRAVIALAVDFRTWQTLVRSEELEGRTAVSLMTRLVAAVGKP